MSSLSNLCKYGKEAGCTECNSILYSHCSTYRKYHANYLIAAVKPFNFQWDKSQNLYKKHQVIWCSGTDLQKIGKIKSNAVNWALENNKPLERISTEQILNRVLNKELEITYTDFAGVFLNLSKKSVRNKDAEITQVIESFITSISDMGVQVFACTRYPLSDDSWFEIKR